MSAPLSEQPLMRVWVDMTTRRTCLSSVPLLDACCEERGDEVEITAREYAQTLELLELHGIEAR